MLLLRSNGWEGTSEMKVQDDSKEVLELPDCFLPGFVKGSSPLVEGFGECSWDVLGLAGDAELPACSAWLDSANIFTLYSSWSVFC